MSGGADGVKDPVQVAVNPGVNPRDALRPAQPGPEADDSYQVPPVQPGLQVRDTSHQTTPTVSHTGVLTIGEH